MLCAPCARALRMAYRDQRARQRRFIDLDPPAPLCHGCYKRPRISKGTRRGKRRYFRFCGPCDRAHRVDQGLPAYRGERGARMWLQDQLRPEEERNRYPWPRSDAEVERPSPFVPMSTLDEVLDDVGALRREEPLDPATLHALLHTPPLFKMDAFIYPPAPPTSTALELAALPPPPMPVPLAPRSADPADRALEEALGSTSSPRGPGVQRGDEPIRGRRSRRVRERREAAGSTSPPSPMGDGGTCPAIAYGRAEDIQYAITAQRFGYLPRPARERRGDELRETPAAIRAAGAAVTRPARREATSSPPRAAAARREAKPISRRPARPSSARTSVRTSTTTAAPPSPPLPAKSPRAGSSRLAPRPRASAAHVAVRPAVGRPRGFAGFG